MSLTVVSHFAAFLPQSFASSSPFVCVPKQKKQPLPRLSTPLFPPPSAAMKYSHQLQPELINFSPQMCAHLRARRLATPAEPPPGNESSFFLLFLSFCSVSQPINNAAVYILYWNKAGRMSNETVMRDFFLFYLFIFQDGDVKLQKKISFLSTFYDDWLFSGNRTCIRGSADHAVCVGILALSRPEPTITLISTNDWWLIFQTGEAPGEAPGEVPGEAPATCCWFPLAAWLPVCNMVTLQTWQQPSPKHCSRCQPIRFLLLFQSQRLESNLWVE